MLDESDKNILQNCLNELCDWAETWGMMFNVDKCKVIHTGNRNPGEGGSPEFLNE